MQLKTTKVTKGIIFAGCSFTWGQGLYYYSNMSSLKEPAPFCYDGDIVKETHIRHMETFRFPRLVANHFNTFELINHTQVYQDDIDFLKKWINDNSLPGIENLQHAFYATRFRDNNDTTNFNI